MYLCKLACLQPTFTHKFYNPAFDLSNKYIHMYICGLYLHG